MAEQRSRRIDLTLEESDPHQLANLCGPLDANLARIADEYSVRISRRGNRFAIAGPSAKTERTQRALLHFFRQSARTLSTEDIQLGLVELREIANSPSKTPPQSTPAILVSPTTEPSGSQGLPEATSDESPVLHTRRSDLHGRTPRQREYLRNILSHDISFGIGPAGTGKTYLAVACAVDALERDAVRRIVLTRPAVEAGERLGFLPGDLAQKVDPYLRPLYDALYDLMGFERTTRMFEKQAIEIAPLAYMRGRTLNHAFVILDEAQNTTPEQMKMFLTRIGFGSRAVVTGDATQIDLPKGQASGLIEARRVLSEVRGIAFTEFDSTDVIRHPLVARIVEAYERHAPRTP